MGTILGAPRQALFRIFTVTPKIARAWRNDRRAELKTRVERSAGSRPAARTSSEMTAADSIAALQPVRFSATMGATSFPLDDRLSEGSQARRSQASIPIPGLVSRQAAALYGGLVELEHAWKQAHAGDGAVAEGHDGAGVAVWRPHG